MVGSNRLYRGDFFVFHIPLSLKSAKENGASSYTKNFIILFWLFGYKLTPKQQCWINCHLFIMNVFWQTKWGTPNLCGTQYTQAKTPKLYLLPPPPPASWHQPFMARLLQYVHYLSTLNKFMKKSLTTILTHSTPPFRPFIDWTNKLYFVEVH